MLSGSVSGLGITRALGYQRIKTRLVRTSCSWNRTHGRKSCLAGGSEEFLQTTMVSLEFQFSQAFLD